jgi:hypothetical protein
VARLICGSDGRSREQPEEPGGVPDRPSAVQDPRCCRAMLLQDSEQRSRGQRRASQELTEVLAEPHRPYAETNRGRFADPRATEAADVNWRSGAKVFGPVSVARLQIPASERHKSAHRLKQRQGLWPVQFRSAATWRAAACRAGRQVRFLPASENPRGPDHRAVVGAAGELPANAVLTDLGRDSFRGKAAAGQARMTE